MDLNAWVKVFDRLLPKSRAWSLILDRTLKKFFHGLAVLPQLVRDHIASILLEAFPQTTSYLGDWSTFFGSPSVLTADELEAEWAAFGGQDPRHIQDVLQAAGLNVYVHEWWEPGSNPPVARNPIALVPTSRVLVNDVNEINKHWIFQFGDGSQFRSDETIYFGAYDGWYWHPKVYPTPDIESEYPVYWYVCDAVWPQYATIMESQLRTLIRLIYKMKPVQTRVILRVTVVPDGDGDIQDTWWSDDQWQDVTTPDDDVQDKT